MEPDIKKNLKLNCRFYENIYPNEGDVVFVEIDKIVENGAYVKLLEYDNIEGMITPNEITKLSNMKSVYRVMKTGKQEVVQVLKVDSVNGYIDLSKKRATAEEKNDCEKRFAQCKVVHTILRAVAQKLDKDIDILYETIVWPLVRDPNYVKPGEKTPFAYFEASLNNKTAFDHLNVDKEVIELLQKEIERRLTPQPIKLRADFELKCFSENGIDDIKLALKAGIALAEGEIKIMVIASPLYVVVTSTFDKKQGIALLNKILEEIEAKIKQCEGTFSLKQQPRVIGEKEDQDPNNEFKELQKHEEADSDEDDGDEEGINADIGVDEEELDKDKGDEKGSDEDAD